MMPSCRSRCSPSILCFLCLLVAGSLTLLVYRNGLYQIQLLPQGFMNMTAPERERDDEFDPAVNACMRTCIDPHALAQWKARQKLQDDVFNSKLPEKKLMNRFLASESSGLEEELQQQLRIQDVRRQILANVCSEQQPDLLRKLPVLNDLRQFYVEDRYKLLYCELPKVSCTNWKRVLIVLAGKATFALDVSPKIAHFGGRLSLLPKFGPEGIIHRLSNHIKILFVREPFERLVSAYRDKLEGPEKTFHSIYGRPILSRYRANASQSALQTGDGVTFREFVQYLLDPKRPVGLNSHWMPFNKLCNPCLLHFDFIGKLENMNSEANFLLRNIGAPPGARFPDYKDKKGERTSSSIMKEYFSQVSSTERQRVYDFFRLDYLLFNYSKPFPDLH